MNWLSWRGRVVADANGRATQLIGVGMDITPRKEAEIRVSDRRADLERRVSELEVLLALLPVGVAIAEDPLCKKIRANNNLLAILGATPADNISLTAPKEERPDWRVFREGRELGPDELPLQRCAGKGVEIRDEVADVVFADGRVVHLLVSANPLRDETGQPKGCVGVLIDITEHRRSEQVSRFLADTSRYLAEIREPHSTLHHVARLAVPFFADVCFIDLKMDNSTLRRAAACSARH